MRFFRVHCNRKEKEEFAINLKSIRMYVRTNIMYAKKLTGNDFLFRANNLKI